MGLVKYKTRYMKEKYVRTVIRRDLYRKLKEVFGDKPLNEILEDILYRYTVEYNYRVYGKEGESKSSTNETLESNVEKPLESNGKSKEGLLKYFYK